jgi:hypothetical protein
MMPHCGTLVAAISGTIGAVSDADPQILVHSLA